MGLPSLDLELPHYFLFRKFHSENDLLIIFQTKRCQYNCSFCELSRKNRDFPISSNDILSQFLYVVNEMRHSLSMVDRITLSNEGSILDSTTFPYESLIAIINGINHLKRVRTIVLETRLEFISQGKIKEMKNKLHRASLNILTGFETKDSYIRNKILNKRETIPQFLGYLDLVKICDVPLTAYVIYKPSQFMSDEAAFIEAEKSIDFLDNECKKRDIHLSLRINPMYAARGSKWALIANRNPDYTPPRLSDIFRLAQQKVRFDLPIYIGLSTEGIDDGHTYLSRDDFSYSLLKQVIQFNNTNGKSR
ncbi:MAG: archaeosine synthase beta-subunit [Chloroflexota bacterium]|nr:archaeosine synthase beta-subunit [Chloroflexota bacterium]